MGILADAQAAGAVKQLDQEGKANRPKGLQRQPSMEYTEAGRHGQADSRAEGKATLRVCSAEILLCL